jgi:fumarate reductase subunit D
MTPQDQQQQAQISAVGGGAETVREQDKVMLVLSYLGILSLIPLLTVKDSDYVKWHAKQGLVYMFGVIPLAIVVFLVSLIPFIGWLFGCAGWIGYFVVEVMAIMRALKGQRWRIPVIADIAEKL